MANHIKNAVVAKTTTALQSHKKCRCGKNHNGTPITFLKIKLRQQTRFSLYS